MGKFIKPRGLKGELRASIFNEFGSALKVGKEVWLKTNEENYFSRKIEAIKMASEVIPNIRLIVVGSGPQKKNIKQLINKLDLENHVILAGYQPDPAFFYKAMDVMVLPSYSGEATSQVLPQAMLMGKPVISTDTGGLSEVVIHNKTGLIVPTKNSLEIFNAIKTLFDDDSLRNRLAEEGRVHALKNFTFEKMIETTEHVYLDLMGH